MSEIKVITKSSVEVQEELELKYIQFKKYYFDTDLYVNDIFYIIGFTNTSCAGVKYIRKRLLEEGYNNLDRVWSIRKGEWLK